jgi:hypothetical protein
MSLGYTSDDSKVWTDHVGPAVAGGPSSLKKPAELNMVELSMRESRLVLEALGIAISQQLRALEVCKKPGGHLN